MLITLECTANGKATLCTQFNSYKHRKQDAVIHSVNGVSMVEK